MAFVDLSDHVRCEERMLADKALRIYKLPMRDDEALECIAILVSFDLLEHHVLAALFLLKKAHVFAARVLTRSDEVLVYASVLRGKEIKLILFV